MLLVRLHIFTILVPGYIAGYLPWSIGPRHLSAGPLWHLIGSLLIATGILIYAHCALRFYTAHGTPAIFFTKPLRHLIGEEPSQLVRSGLYRYSRNPLYLGVLTIIFGQACLFASRSIALYGLFVFACFHAVVVLVEEPHLRRRDPDAYRVYTESAPRWLGLPRR